VRVAIPSEEPKEDCGEVCEEVHEDGGPEDPGEVAGILSGD
jgi:hypothetical protein